MKLFLLSFVLFIVVGCEEASPVNTGEASKEYAWSQELRNQLLMNLSDFKSASDWTNYCQKWNKLDDNEKVKVLYELSIQICNYESNCNPTVISPDDVGNTASIGLYQLSYEDNMKWCEMDAKKKNLTDPFVNIRCAIPKMAQLIKENGVVAEGYAKGTRRGLARYWAVMWSSKQSKSGHKEQITEAVQKLGFCK